MCLPPTLPQLPKLSTQPNVPQTDDRIEILEVFAELSDSRRAAGKRHQVSLCLALFTKRHCGRQPRLSRYWRLVD